jgi:hypothetical protein
MTRFSSILKKIGLSIKRRFTKSSHANDSNDYYDPPHSNYYAYPYGNDYFDSLSEYARNCHDKGYPEEVDSWSDYGDSLPPTPTPTPTAIVIINPILLEDTKPKTSKSPTPTPTIILDIWDTLPITLDVWDDVNVIPGQM